MLRRRAQDDRGAVALIMVFLTVVFMAFAAYIVDLGLARQIRRDAQNAADAAALAGAAVLYNANGTFDAARAEAEVKDYAAKNLGITAADWAGCTATKPAGWATGPSGSNCIVFDTLTAGSFPKRIQVTLPVVQTPSLFRGGGQLPVRAAAQAELNPNRESQCALCVSDIVNVGTGDVTVHGGGTVHSHSAVVQQVNGSITVYDGGFIEFTTTPNPPSSFVNYHPNPPVISGRPVPDPFAATPLPTAPWPQQSAALRQDDVTCGQGGVSELEPGVYKNITVKNATCTFKDGLYVVVGELFMASNTDTLLKGNNVTLYFTCGTRAAPQLCTSSSPSPGHLDFSGNGTISIGAPYVDPYVIVYDRQNHATLELSGNAIATNLGGAVYALNAETTISGNGTLNVGGQVVLDEVTLNGNNTKINISKSGLEPRFVYPDQTLRMTN